MVFKDILTIVTSQSANEHVFAFAEQLARQDKGRVSAVTVNWQPNVTPVEGWVVDPMFGQLFELANQHLRDEAGKVKTRLAAMEQPGHARSYLLDIGAAGAVLGLCARHADVSVVARPTKSNSDSAHAILEGVLFSSGRPVFVVPPEWKGGEIGRTLLIAWKPTREAARSVADGADLITSAKKVGIVTVEAGPGAGYGEQPGADLAAHLAFRGAKPEVFNLDAGGRTETKAMLDQAMAIGADLIVMGGYGRSRVSEWIFGGVTREILKTSTVPVLISH